MASHQNRYLMNIQDSKRSFIWHTEVGGWQFPHPVYTWGQCTKLTNYANKTSFTVLDVH
jgi:hypothetical protein